VSSKAPGLIYSASRSVTDPSTDPTIRGLREEISAIDHSLVETLNTRLSLVSRLKGYKESKGLEFVDREREQRIISDLTRANGGPLSSEGLCEIYAAIFELMKREASRGPDAREA
jgi:chorismate mutase